MSCVDPIAEAFSKVCSDLEIKANNKLKTIERECANITFNTQTAISNSNNSISSINDTCLELVQTDELMKILLEAMPKKEAILLHHNMHAETVKCLQGIYNISFTPLKLEEKPIVNDQSKKLIADVVRETSCFISELKNIESTILDIQENSKVV